MHKLRYFTFVDCSVGVHMASEVEAMRQRMESAQLRTHDLTSSDLVKDHLRYMVNLNLLSLMNYLHLQSFLQHSQEFGLPDLVPFSKLEWFFSISNVLIPNAELKLIGYHLYHSFLNLPANLLPSFRWEAD